MAHYNDYIKDFMAYYRYPAEAVECFAAVEKRLDVEADFGAAFDAISDAFLQKKSVGLGDALKQIDALAAEKGISPYTLDFVFIMNGTETVKKWYAERGIAEQVFWDTWDDLRCKLGECMECKGVPGTFVAGWYGGFFAMELFSYGRFEYHLKVFDWDMEYAMQCGRIFKPGDLYVNMHIPSSGVPLTDEVRFDSYRKAYKAFQSHFPDGKVIFGCGSWLLYPNHRKFLPENSNILKFMGDFEQVSYELKDEFYYDWRIFGRYAGLPYDQLPRDTALRRAYADWMAAGNKSGDAFGIFMFDGEKIIR